METVMCFNASYATRHKFCLSGCQIWPHTEQHIKHVIPRNQTSTHIHSFNPLNHKFTVHSRQKVVAKLPGFASPLIHSFLMSGAHGTRIRSAAGKGSPGRLVMGKKPSQECVTVVNATPQKRNMSWFRTRRLSVRFMVGILPLDVFIYQIINEDPYMPLLFAYPNTMLLVGWAHACEAVWDHLRWDTSSNRFEATEQKGWGTFPGHTHIRLIQGGAPWS